MDLAAGIDIGGSSAKIGLVERTGRILAKASVSIAREDTFEDIMAQVVRCLAGLLKGLGGGERLRSIGIGTPGFIDKKDGILVGGSENIPALKRRSIQSYLGGVFAVPAFADNDATCAAAGEREFGAGRTFSDFVLITVGTAIGGGLVMGGRVYRGWRGFAGEIGHLCVNPGGLWCNCGSRGCFEQYASGTAITRIYAEKQRKRGITPPSDMTSRSVVDAARAGDDLASDTLSEAGRWMAQAFGSILNVLDLEACIISGGVSEAGDILIDPIRRHLPDHCWPQICQGVQVRAGELRNDAGILGAAAQAFQRLET
jgi:glucokinase